MRKNMFKLLLRTILYLSVGVFVFLELINFIQFPVAKNVPVEQVFSLDKEAEEMNQTLINLNVYEDYKIKTELSEKLNLNREENLTLPINKENTLIENLINRYVFFEYVFKNNNTVIPLLYLLTMLTFLVQIILLSWSNHYNFLLNFFKEKKLDSIFLYSSEWAINAPPVLGVIGTIFAFGMVVSNLSDLSSLSTVFKENFANAALTTIIGGSVYVLNLFINIFIAKNLSK